MAAAGADEVILADTIGVGVPRQVTRAASREALEGGKPVGLHLHNTRNTGYANAIAGLEHGATIFDASVGGLGGCPFAPRATGNIATEDLIYLLENEGVETGRRPRRADRRRRVAVGRAGPRATRPAAARGQLRSDSDLAGSTTSP